MLADSSLPELPPALRRAKRAAASAAASSSSKKQRRATQPSHQIPTLGRLTQPIVNPDDYIIPFKQASAVKELVIKHQRYLESLNRIYRCFHCGLNYKAINNFQHYGCRMHPGIAKFDPTTGTTHYTCCYRKFSDPDIGCTPCMHSRDARGRKQIVRRQIVLFLAEELVDAAIEEGGSFECGTPDETMIYLSYMSKEPHYDLPKQFIFTCNPTMISRRENQLCYFPSVITTPYTPQARAPRKRRSILNQQ